MEAWSIKALKAELVARNIPHADCTEKSELVERLKNAPASRPRQAAQPPPPPPPPAAPSDPHVVRVLDCPPGAYYRILNVQSDASADALKKAYRVLALRLHPDKCSGPGADEAFKRVSAAFAALNDPQERAYHDRRGGDAAATADAASPSASTAATRRAPAAHHRRHQHFGDRDAEELFRAFFGDEAFGHAGGGGPGGDPSHPSTALSLQRMLSLTQRLGKTFVTNPWTLVTLLSALASLVSIFESLYEILGGWLMVAVPAAAVGLAGCPPHQRRQFAVGAAGVLLSVGMLL